MTTAATVGVNPSPGRRRGRGPSPASAEITVNGGGVDRGGALWRSWLRLPAADGSAGGGVG